MQCSSMDSRQRDESCEDHDVEVIPEASDPSNDNQTTKETPADKTEAYCYICKKSDTEGDRLRQFENTTWKTVKNTASLRQNLKSDKYSDVTEMVLSITDEKFHQLSYHRLCHKYYTAVKRPRESQLSDDPPLQTQHKRRRSSGNYKSDQQDLLKGSCIFCRKVRKKRKGKEEPRIPICTTEGCSTIYNRAESSTNERLKLLIRSQVDLIAKEAEYHKSCWLTFLKETEDIHVPTSSQSHTYHKRSLASLMKYIEEEVVHKKGALLVSDALEMYKKEYIAAGGEERSIEGYGSQNLLRKVQEKCCQEIKVALVDQRRGNFLYHESHSEDQARDLLQDDEENRNVRWAALHLRTQILKLPKTKTPNPATVQNLKECAIDIPPQLELFFRTLLGGISQSDAHREAIDRKITAMSSDVIYNVTRGTVKPWKHTVLGLGLSSLTGSKLAMQILNRSGHCISYSESKGLETEFAYTVESKDRDTPDGIQLSPYLGTACVWDNYDANVETLDGKHTLHATVGHTYQNIVQDQELESVSPSPFVYREGKNRRSFVGARREIEPFRKSLKKAQFYGPLEKDIAGTSAGLIEPHDDVASSISDGADASEIPPLPCHHTYDKITEVPNLSALDFVWWWKLQNENIPLHAGFMSRFIKDQLPLHRIAYMEPMAKSPTNNDIVRETMVRSLNVAKETGQDHAVVTYDLAVALKAYSIQALESPVFDKLLIMLGNFHIELAFYGAIGTFINASGIEYILTEADILAEGSMVGFIKGKFYNRCTRIHELLANALEKKLYNRFLQNAADDDIQALQEVMSMIPETPDAVEHLSNPVIVKHIKEYEEYLWAVIGGHLGQTAQFWATYIFLINRLHREVQRCVKTNDVNGYIRVLPMLLEVYFALNRPNYARWGTLFLQKLRSAHPNFLEILTKGAFSVRRTKKNYSRSAVDLSLEQTVNRDAASQMKGIVAFRNSENAVKRWSIALTQRAMAVTELRSFSGLDNGESPSVQCRPSRVCRDNKQMATLSATIDEFCNPFSPEAPTSLVNLATGQTASDTTTTYLLDTLKRGKGEREKFQEEWSKDSNRFLRSVRRIKVNNFANDNLKNKKNRGKSQNYRSTAESLRDMFVRMVVVIAEKSSFDLRYVLTYPITTYPLSLSHCDGNRVKTSKATLLKKLESHQSVELTQQDIPRSYVQVYDGGLLLHSIISQTHPGSNYASVARSMLSVVMSGKASEAHVCLDKYEEGSIKDSERRLRGAVDTNYTITGPEQTIRQSASKLLSSASFKNEFSKFILKEWGKAHYWKIFNGKTLFASYGGDCYQYTPDNSGNITVTHPAFLQGNHEEADTLVAFHVNNITSKNIMVRASDTDILVILIASLGQLRPEVRSAKLIIMDCGMGNNRRFINVSNITDVLEESTPGLLRAMPAYHAFTGCDFTSAFYRKGKTKPLEIITKDETGRFLNLFIRMGDPEAEGIDVDVASEFVCYLYAQHKVNDVNLARYNKLMQMTGRVDEDNPLANIKRVDCALLPPCRRTLEMKVRRTMYVARLWMRAVTSFPCENLSPIDHGWAVEDNILAPLWFEGPAIPEKLMFAGQSTEDLEQSEDDGESSEDSMINTDDEAWSEQSDSELEDSDIKDNMY
ncbi:uncharacterized protein LOC121428475 [Lytechinus variegatus]|uniref:uncharacterized protein LOC121428475 n=1 Tax=Lytechinus variegatus TaxID=7654 RepID=UPI001BB107D9|nr:uncharacterized protein LOC121428475 [Lytechinus variegatus]